MQPALSYYSQLLTDATATRNAHERECVTPVVAKLAPLMAEQRALHEAIIRARKEAEIRAIEDNFYYPTHLRRWTMLPCVCSLIPSTTGVFFGVMFMLIWAASSPNDPDLLKYSMFYSVLTVVSLPIFTLLVIIQCRRKVYSESSRGSRGCCCVSSGGGSEEETSVC